jgi:cyclophilin family peptidyl-prolyl cis-trans isomerase
MTTLLISLVALAAEGVAQPPKPALAPSEIVAAAPTADWVEIAPTDLLVMTLASGKQAIIQLIPPPFSLGWVGNIRTLATARWWDGLSINRVQDNYVVQWGDASEKKALPAGLAAMGEISYETPLASPGFNPFSKKDAYAAATGFLKGWPVAASMPSPQSGKARSRSARQPSFSKFWPIHCYGMVGVGRNLSPDTGSGAELYAVIGHAPRHLDRNIAVVGRVISGIEHLSSLSRGTGALGFYEKAEERVLITSIRVASELPTSDQPRFEYLSTESKSFAAYADARANRRDAFFIRPAGGADICNIPVPVRKKI